MLKIERSGGEVTLRMNRPEVGNAINDVLVGEMLAALKELSADAGVRSIVLTGAGKVFSAGADLNYMRKMKQTSHEENVRDAERTAGLFSALYDFPRPVIAAVNGSARGGGVGLVAACDFAIGVERASFAFTEVRLGVVPAMISPFVLKKMGESRARRLFLTGEVFSAEQASEWGLLDRAVPGSELERAVGEFAETLRQCGPEAVGRIKELVRAVTSAPPAEIPAITARMIAEIRTTPEAQEGMSAFLQKRKPNWS